MRRIVKNKSKLRTPSVPVALDRIGSALTRLMMRTRHQRDGSMGFAGNQVGMTESVLTALIGGSWRCFANPQIIVRSSEMNMNIEGCLSLPGKQYEVRRYDWVTIVHQDSNDNHIEESFEGLDAVVIQHEIDHLNGVLISDIGVQK